MTSDDNHTPKRRPKYFWWILLAMAPVLTIATVATITSFVWDISSSDEPEFEIDELFGLPVAKYEGWVAGPSSHPKFGFTDCAQSRVFRIGAFWESTGERPVDILGSTSVEVPPGGVELSELSKKLAEAVADPEELDRPPTMFVGVERAGRREVVVVALGYVPNADGEWEIGVDRAGRVERLEPEAARCASELEGG
jgi:hypothetical protein